MGVNTTFKGVSTFCVTSAIVMTTIYFTVFTLYIAFLYLILDGHERREAKKEKERRAERGHHRRRRHHHHHHRKHPESQMKMSEIEGEVEDNDFITNFFR